MSRVDLDALRDFTLVAEHGGFGLASRSSGRSKATLSRRIVELEAQLDTRLFERIDQGLKLTAAGVELLENTRAPLRELDAATMSVRSNGKALAGRLRISAAVLFAHTDMARIAAGFCAIHPGVALEVVAEDRVVNMVDEDFDIVIRANPDANERLVGRCIARNDRHAVAAPSIQVPASGEAASVIHRIGENLPSKWCLLFNGKKQEREITLISGLRLSTLMMIRQAALTGAGVALLPYSYVRDDLITGRLRSWGTQVGVQTELWVLHTSRRFSQEKVKCFISYLIDCIEGEKLNGQLA